jgi:hypothetical protein
MTTGAAAGGPVVTGPAGRSAAVNETKGRELKSM